MSVHGRQRVAHVLRVKHCFLLAFSISMCLVAWRLSKLAVLTLGLLQGVAEAESRRAADAAEAAYQAAFKTDTPADEVALGSEYERALSIGQRAFREVAVG